MDKLEKLDEIFNTFDVSTSEVVEWLFRQPGVRPELIARARGCRKINSSAGDPSSRQMSFAFSLNGDGARK